MMGCDVQTYNGSGFPKGSSNSLPLHVATAHFSWHASVSLLVRVCYVWIVIRFEGFW